MSHNTNGRKELGYNYRLRLDHSQESFAALKTMHAAGLCIQAVPVSGTMGPELVVGARVYCGLGEIESFVKQLTQVF